jgi:hypothetical protein
MEAVEEEREFYLAEFIIELKKTPETGSLGVELDSLGGGVLEVCGIRDGLVKEYNTNCANIEKQVQIGDFFTAVNGLTGISALTIVERIQRDNQLCLTIRRPRPWQVNLTHTPQNSGSSIRPSLNCTNNARSVLVLDISSDRVIQAWNAAHPNRDIRMNDRILVVNGICSESVGMMKEVESAPLLKMLVVRPAVDWSGPSAPAGDQNNGDQSTSRPSGRLRATWSFDRFLKK